MIRFNKSFFLFAFISVLITLTISLAGCNSKKNSDSNNTNNTYSPSTDKKGVATVVKTEKYNIKLELEKYNIPGIFSLDKPKG